jgi:cytochrome c553
VPESSIAKGEALVKSGGSGQTVACGTCHGQQLEGIGDVPSIRGTSPLYLSRQLLDMQNGARAGPGAALMKPVVEKLTVDDVIAIAAYLATLQP